MAAETRRPGAAECWVVFLVALGCYLLVAHYLVFCLGRADWDALAGTAHAYEAAIAARPPNLSLVGFADPPLPVILQLPVVAIAPRLGIAGFAANVVACAFGAIACVTVCKLLGELRAGPSLRWALVTVFGLSPAWLRGVTEGSSVALFGFLFAACALYFVRWSREGVLRDLVLCGVAAAGMVLTHFESAGAVAALCLAFAVVIRRDRGGSWSEVEGTLITFLLPVLYGALLWFATSWAIMGDPLFPIRAMARTPEPGILALFEFLLMTALVTWCRVGSKLPRPAWAWLSATVAAVLLIGGAWGIAAWRTQRLSIVGAYAFLQPPPPEERTLAELRLVGRAVRARCGAERVLVDSQVDFAIGLLSGHPYQFVRPADLQSGGRRPGAERTDVSFVLTDSRAPNVGLRRARALAGPGELRPVWSRAEWTLYSLRPAGTPPAVVPPSE